jgi:hypothetical protein
MPLPLYVSAFPHSGKTFSPKPRGGDRGDGDGYGMAMEPEHEGVGAGDCYGIFGEDDLAEGYGDGRDFCDEPGNLAEIISDEGVHALVVMARMLGEEPEEEEEP